MIYPAMDVSRGLKYRFQKALPFAKISGISRQKLGL